MDNKIKVFFAMCKSDRAQNLKLFTFPLGAELSFSIFNPLQLVLLIPIPASNDENYL